MDLRLSCFGPFRVTGLSEQPVTLPSRSAEALLAFLALWPGRRFRRADLIRTLWPDRPPEGASGYLRVSLSRLRGALHPAGGCVCAERDEIWLDPAAVWTDLGAFRETGNPDLVSGPLLEGWEHEWLQPARSAIHLEVGRRLLAGAAGALRAGAVAEAISAAERLLRLDPTEEQGYQILMRAHLAQGEPETALLLFRRCQAALAAELAVAPSPETERLAAEAGRAAALIDYGRRGPSTLVGRTAERRALLDLLAGSGPNRAVILGEPGIGKTALLQEALQAARAQGFRVLEAACQDGPPPPPYQVLAEVLRSAGPAALRSLPEGLRSGLALLLPELGAPVPGGPGENRLRLVNAGAGALRQIAEPAPLLLAIEDLQWSDPASVHALATIWPLLPPGQVRMLATCRSEGMAERSDLRDWARREEADQRLLPLHLGPLSSAECAELAERLAPGLSPIMSSWLERETNGNPLFLTEWVRAARGLPQTPPPDTPPGIQRLLLSRFLRLPEEARSTLEAAAVLGLSFPLKPLASLLGRSGRGVAGEVEELVERGLLVDEGSTCRFFHARFREAVLAQMRPIRRRALHAQAARVTSAPAEAAYHAEEGHDWSLAFTQLVSAGRAAMALGAAGEAREMYSRALQNAERAGDVPPLTLAGALLGREAALSALGDAPGQEADLDRAEAIAIGAGDRELVVRVTTRRALLLDRLGRWREAEREGERAVRLARQMGEGSDCLAEALERVAVLAWSRGLTRLWLTRSLHAVEASRQAGNLLREGHSLQQLAAACHYRGRYEEMHRHAEAALALAQRLGDRMLRIEASRHIAWYQLITGQEEAACRLYEELVEAAGRLGDLATECFLSYLLATACAATGQAERSLAASEQAVCLAGRLQNPKLLSWSHRVLAQSHLLAGNPAAAKAGALAALTGARETGAPHDLSAAGLQLAQVHLALGHVDEAAAWASQQRPAVSGRTPPVSLGLCATVTEALVAAGPREEARRWALWTRRWRSFLGPYCLRSLQAQSLRAEAAAQRA